MGKLSTNPYTMTLSFLHKYATNDSTAMTPNDQLLALVRGLTPVERQNRLSRVGDREIALAMRYMRDPDRTMVLSHLPPAKTRRIREELRLHTRLRITYADYLKAVELVSDGISGSRGRGSLGSYLRPHR